LKHASRGEFDSRPHCVRALGLSADARDERFGPISILKQPTCTHSGDESFGDSSLKLFPLGLPASVILGSPDYANSIGFSQKFGHCVLDGHKDGPQNLAVLEVYARRITIRANESFEDAVRSSGNGGRRSAKTFDQTPATSSVANLLQPGVGAHVLAKPEALTPLNRPTPVQTLAILERTHQDEMRPLERCPISRGSSRLSS
jgi:hypothetical protein